MVKNPFSLVHLRIIECIRGLRPLVTTRSPTHCVCFSGVGDRHQLRTSLPTILCVHESEEGDTDAQLTMAEKMSVEIETNFREVWSWDSLSYRKLRASSWSQLYPAGHAAFSSPVRIRALILLLYSLTIWSQLLLHNPHRFLSSMTTAPTPSSNSC